jgi:hypothetical protein
VSRRCSGIGLPDILVPARFCPTVITPNRFNWCGRVRKASKKNVKSLRQESYTMKSLETVKKLYDKIVRNRKRKRDTPSRVLVHIQFLRLPGLRIDLPLKLIVWENGAGKVRISYNNPKLLN